MVVTEELISECDSSLSEEESNIGHLGGRVPLLNGCYMEGILLAA
jgi:hypothetical protein